MVARLLEQEQAVRRVISEDRKTAHLIPTWQDIEVLESVQAALGPLADFTDMLSGEEHVTVSTTKPVLHLLKTKVLVESDGDTTLTADVKARILQSMEGRYKSRVLNELLNVATFLDPRFMAYFTTDAVELAVVKDRLVCEGSELPGEQDDSPKNPGTESAEGAGDLSTVPPSKRKKLGSWLKEAQPDSGNSTLTIEASVRKEVENYLLAPKADAESNPFLWWQAHALSYRILAQLAKRYLCICASSSASERVFSTSGDIVSRKRSTLKPDKVNMLVCLAKNL